MLALDVVEIMIELIKTIPESNWNEDNAKMFLDETANELVRSAGHEVRADDALHVLFPQTIVTAFVASALKRRGIWRVS